MAGTGGVNLAVSLELTDEQKAAYARDGFLHIPGFLSEAQLAEWRRIVDAALEARGSRKFHTGEEDHTNVDRDYYDKVFVQRVNLFRSDDGVKRLWEEAGPGIGKAVTELEAATARAFRDAGVGDVADAGVAPSGMRIWHDQALVKRPWSNPTGFHNDMPYWSFDSAHAASLWVALDDATTRNGSLHMIPGSHTAILGEGEEGALRETKISKNVGAMMTEDHPDSLAGMEAVALEYRAGDASIHNGLTAHGAGPNMTPRSRRAMTLQMMPVGAAFSGKRNILSKGRFESLAPGDGVADDIENPLLWESGAETA